MSDPISKSSYLPWYFGGGAGVPHFRRMAELAPYETDYFGMEIHLGIEPVQFFNVPLLWKTRLQSSLLVDGEFSYAGGDEMNLGSHRMMGMAHTGLRMRLFLASRFAIYLDLLAGLGVSHSEMNFGKGIPLPEDTAGNVGGKGELGFEIRVSDNVSLAPAVAFQGDMSFNGETDYTNWMVSGVMGVHISDDDSRSRAFEEAEKEQKKREKKLNEQMERISEREKELAEREKKAKEVKEIPK